MNLIKSTSTFSFFTLISRITGYFRDVLIAIFLGSGPVADAFFVAFRIPNTFRRLFSEGTFNAAFVPSYSSQLVVKKKAKYFANTIFNILLLSLLFLAILNTHNKFAAASASPIILNIFLIITLSFSNYLNDQLVFYLSFAVSIAGLVQLLFLIYFVKKYFVPTLSFKFNIDDKVKLFFKKLLPSIFSSGVTQINILIGTIIASFQASAVSYLYYADRIYQINLAVAGIAIGTVILPSLSKYIQTNNKKKIIFIQNKSLELSLFLSLPATAALLIASEQITSSLFGYGSFDELSVKNSSLALFYFALGLPAFSLIKVFSSFLFARHNTIIPFYFSIISVLINVGISLYYFKDIGFIIIPIATSISSWINAFILFLYLNYKNYFFLKFILITNLLKIILVTAVSSYIFYYQITIFSNSLTYDSKYKILFIFFSVIITIISYIIISIATKAFKLSDIKLKY